MANLGGAWRGTRLRRVRPSGVLLHPSGTGICGKSGDAREGPSAEVIIAAQDGYKGRLAPAWKMCIARAAHPVGAAPACLSSRRRMRVRSPTKLAKVELSYSHSATVAVRSAGHALTFRTAPALRLRLSRLLASCEDCGGFLIGAALFETVGLAVGLIALATNG